TTFALMVTLAGAMKQAYQVLARAGVVIFILLQWPLWTGGFFETGTPLNPMVRYTAAGSVAAVAALVYVGMTLFTIWRYRRRINQDAILVGIVILLAGQI